MCRGAVRKHCSVKKLLINILTHPTLVPFSPASQHMLRIQEIKMATTKPKEAPKNVQSDALIHPTAVLTGNHQINIGSKVIVQPRTLLDSTYGPIDVGANTVIAERCTIASTSPPPQGVSPITVGEGVIIETGATVAAAAVGDFTIIGVQAKIGKRARIGANCKVAQGVTVRIEDEITDNTIVWGDEWDQRRTESEDGGLRIGAGREGLSKGMGDGLRAVWSSK